MGFEHMLLLFLFIVFIVPLFAIYGMFLSVFRQGKKKLGLAILGLSIIVFFVGVIAFSKMDARNEGFENPSDMRDAKRAGILDADEWSALKAAKETERLAATKKRNDELKAAREDEEQKIK